MSDAPKTGATAMSNSRHVIAISEQLNRLSIVSSNTGVSVYHVRFVTAKTGSVRSPTGDTLCEAAVTVSDSFAIHAFTN
jgi:hypothetical protein